MPKLHDDDHMAWIDSHWVTVVLVALVLLILYFAHANAAADCMTKAEARVHWPRAHIYWHGSDRCWDNRRGGRGKRNRYRDPVFSDKKVATVTFHPPAQVEPVTEPVYRPLVFVPSLDRYMRFMPWERRVAGAF